MRRVVEPFWLRSLKVSASVSDDGCGDAVGPVRVVRGRGEEEGRAVGAGAGSSASGDA